VLQDLKRIFARPIIDAEHDDRAHAGPQHAWVAAALRACCKPVHVAMAAQVEELAEILGRASGRTGIGHPDAVKAERAGFAFERGFEISG
jgi:hypothetical protein